MDALVLPMDPAPTFTKSDCVEREAPVTVEQIMEIALRGKVNPAWLTADEIRALALYLQSVETKN